MLGPILFLIYISDIGDNLSVEPLVYIDDTKAIKKIHNEDDVEKLQEDIAKLHECPRSKGLIAESACAAESQRQQR